MENLSNKKVEIKNIQSPIPEGVNEEYFWRVVNIIAGAKPADGENYKGGSIQSFYAGKTKSGEYEPFMDEVIMKAQKEVLDPNSRFSEDNLKKEREGVWIPKRDLLADAYNNDKKFPEDQTHADLGDDIETRLD